MNSDLMPSPEPENVNASNQAEIDVVANEEHSNAATTPEPENVVDSVPDNSSESDSESSSKSSSESSSESLSSSSSSVTSNTATDGSEVNRQHPIPPPSEPMQYRAIGLVRGRYLASSEQFTQGTLLTPDGTELNSVLLGRIMSLVKNHLDLDKDHLWVVYPRTRQENESLHVQIVGVWEPENLAKADTSESEADSQTSETQTDEDVINNTQAPTATLVPSFELPDGEFSVRGEVVYQSYEPPSLVIKIRQQPRKKDEKPKYFKLKLLGKLEGKAVGKFFDFQAKREADNLVIENAKFIAELPKKRRPPFNKGGGFGGRRPFNRAGSGPGGPGGSRKPYRKPAPGSPTPRPVKKQTTGDSSSRPTSPPNPSRPVPKPIKKPKASEE